MTEPKIIGRWSGSTHGKVQFASEEEAREFAGGYNGEPLGWYWAAGDISKDDDGTWWVVIP